MVDEAASEDQDRTEQIDSVDLSVDRSGYTETEGTQWCLEIVRGPMTGERIFLKDGTLTFGRGSDRDVFLDDITVSRHHCDIEVDGENVTVIDKGSTNGTYVDSQEVESKRIYAGDVIQIGRFVFVLTRRSAP